MHEAVRRALQKLGKAEDEVDVTVVSRGSPPQILAFGAEPAQVRGSGQRGQDGDTGAGAGGRAAGATTGNRLMTRKTPAADADLQGTRDAEFAQTMLAELLDRMGLTLDIQVRSIDPVTLNAVGPGVAELIGRRGTTLHALQFVLSIMVNKQLGRAHPARCGRRWLSAAPGEPARKHGGAAGAARASDWSAGWSSNRCRRTSDGLSIWRSWTILR